METLKELNVFSPAQFKSWLEKKFGMLHDSVSAERYRAFDFREAGIPLSDSPSDNLLGLFDKLSVPAQSNLRRAAGELVLTAPLGSMTVPAMQDLESFALRIAAIEELEELIARIIESKWSKTHPELIWCCSLVAEHRGKRQEAERLRNMVYARQASAA